MNEHEKAPYTEFVSDEPLDVIEANECQGTETQLATMRFRRLFNEIAALQAAAEAARAEEREKVASFADRHAEFCRKEARAGGSPDLYERAKGVAYIAAASREGRG